MNRRSFILVGVAAPGMALAMPTEAIEATVDLGRLDEHVVRLRHRMTTAGRRTLARYRHQLAGGKPLSGEVETTVRRGLAAMSVVPSLRRMTPAEQATPAVQALLAEVVLDVGSYVLAAHDAVEAMLTVDGPGGREAVVAMLVSLGDQADDDDFGRSSLVTLRRARRELQERVATGGAEAVAADLSSTLVRLHAEAGMLAAEPDGAAASLASATPSRELDLPGRVLAMAAGMLMLGVGVVGTALLASGLVVLLGGGSLAGLGLLVALVGGALAVLGFATAPALLRRGRLPSRTRAWDGSTRLVLVPYTGWFESGIVLANTSLAITVYGDVWLPRGRGHCDAAGFPGTRAGPGAPVPESPLAALVARTPAWAGTALDELGAAREVPLSGPLEFAVNVPEGIASSVGGAFQLRLAITR